VNKDSRKAVFGSCIYVMQGKEKYEEKLSPLFSLRKSCTSCIGRFEPLLVAVL
jgi:hypothetical protein